jgi:hypothetical protein
LGLTGAKDILYNIKYMFPNDTKFIGLKAYGTETGATLLTSASNERTILYVSSNCSSGLGDILAGSVPIASYSGTNSSIYAFERYILPINTPITYTKVSSANCFYRILYTDYNITSLATSTLSTSTINGFTYGEVLIVLLLLMIFTLSFFSELKNWLFGVFIENQVKGKYDKTI